MSRSQSYYRIGEMLVADGFITEQQLFEALVFQRKTQSRFGEVLVQLGFVSEDVIVDTLAKQFDQPVIDLEQVEFSQKALKLVDFNFAWERLCLPFEVTEMELKVAISDPLDIPLIDQLSAKAQKKVCTYLCSATVLKRFINRLYLNIENKPAKPKKTRPQKDRMALLDLVMSEDVVTGKKKTKKAKEAA